VAAVYAEGQRYMEAGEWQQALECLEEVQRLEPDYRETEELLS
jgi:outer membrane protein assembly factor BamD (BamD/ComL family)